MRDIIEKKYTPLEISTINDLAVRDPAELVRISESYYNDQVLAAALMIKENPKYKFVLLCGPSASGKTTTAHKLKHRLISQGVGARVVSMDNFYRGMENYNRLPNGKPDMESVQTLDMNLLNACFDMLLQEGKAMFPVFDFEAQKQHLAVHSMELGEHDVLIMEGIHALNPMVLSNIPRANVFRMYVSVRTKFVDGENTILVPKDIRLMRRMVRDTKFRNYPPEHTLDYWIHVVESERINIDLYRDDVNLKMDNTIDYEVCVWHELLSGVLEACSISHCEYPQLQKIFDGLQHFSRLDYGLIPTSSLLREFIGEAE